jgi:capsular polysaccharide biosynthesis protein
MSKAMEPIASDEAASPGADTGVSSALGRRWRTAVLAFVLVLVAGVTAVQLYPTRWAATAVVSFTPRTDVSVDTVALVAQRYAVVVTSDATAERIAAETSGASADAIAGAISTELEVGTGNLRITVALPTRATAVAAANAAADGLQTVAQDDELVTGTVAAGATERGATLTPPRQLLYAAVVASALLLAVVLAVLHDRLTTALRRRRTPGDAGGAGNAVRGPQRGKSAAGAQRIDPTRAQVPNRGASGAAGRQRPRPPQGRAAK